MITVERICKFWSGVFVAYGVLCAVLAIEAFRAHQFGPSMFFYFLALGNLPGAVIMYWRSTERPVPGPYTAQRFTRHGAVRAAQIAYLPHIGQIT